MKGKYVMEGGFTADFSVQGLWLYDGANGLWLPSYQVRQLRDLVNQYVEQKGYVREEARR